MMLAALYKMPMVVDAYYSLTQRYNIILDGDGRLAYLLKLWSAACDI